MRRVLCHPLPWFAVFAVWFGTLWWLSSKVHHFPPAMDFQMSDKVMHFGYFLGGGILAAGFFQLLKPAWPWERSALCAIFICTITGAIDEWHQTKVPNRSGNDAEDLVADFVGGMAGASLAAAILQRLRRRDLAAGTVGEGQTHHMQSDA